MKKTTINQTILFLLGFCPLPFGVFAQQIQQVLVQGNHHQFVQQSVALYSPDRFIVAGTVHPGPISGDSDILVLMADDSGNVIWSKYVDYGADEFTGAVIVDFEDNIVLTGYTGINGTRNKNLIVAKLDGSGNYVMDIEITDADLFGYGLYGFDLEQTENGYIVVGTGVDGANQASDKYAFVMCLRTDLRLMYWGRIYQSTINGSPLTPINYDSFNHILKLEHPQWGESFLLTGSGSSDFPNSNQMVVNDLIDPITGLSLWNTSYAQGNKEPDSYDNIGVMSLYNQADNKFYVLYYGSDDFPPNRRNIPTLMTLDGNTGGSGMEVAFFNPNLGNRNNIFSGMEWSNPNQDEIVLTGYHVDAANPPGTGHPLFLGYDLTTGSNWLRYGTTFDGDDYSSINFDFIVQPINTINPTSPYELNQRYYHPKSMVVKPGTGKEYVFSSPHQHQPSGVFGLNLLNTGSDGNMVCSAKVEGLDELAMLADFQNFGSMAYTFGVLEPGATIYNAVLTNDLICEGVPKPFFGMEEKTQGNRNIQTYPNPAKNVLYVSGLPNTNKATITLYDLQGKKVLSRNHHTGNEAQLDVSTLESGLYFLKVSEGGESVFVERVILR